LASYDCSSVLTSIFWQPSPGRPVLEVLSWNSCSTSPILAILFQLISFSVLY
jgi:glycerol kinase